MAGPHSIKRIAGWSSFLALALFLGLGCWYLPPLLNLDQFRPDFIDLMEKTFHCKAEIGHVRLELIPSPGLSVGRVTLLEDAEPPRVLAAGSLRVALSWTSLLAGRLRFTSIRFLHPVFIVHRQPDAQGNIHWISLALPRAGTSDRSADVERLDMRNGSLEIWDHATTPATRWVVNDLTGSFQMRAQQGAMTGHVLFLGRHSALDVHYQGQAVFPVQAHLTEVSLEALQAILPEGMPAPEGTAEITARARFEPTLDIRAVVSPLLLQRLEGTRMAGSISFQDRQLRAHLQTLTPTPMRLDVQIGFRSDGWDLKGDIHAYDADVIHKLYDQFWLNRLDGGGSIVFAAQSRRAAETTWNWSVKGRDFRLAETVFRLPQWSAEGNARTSVVDVHLETAQSGMGEVVWEKPSASPAASLTVDVTSVTVRQILEIFQLESKSEHPEGSMNPYGYEPWRIEKGSMEATLHEDVMEVRDSDIDIFGMHVDLAGTFGLSTSSAQARIQGDILRVPLEPVTASFFGAPAPVTGLAQTDFNLTFPLSAAWVHGLSGEVQVDAANGLIRSFQTFYRVMSVLNLTNYLRLRLPQVTAKGILFQALNGRFRFQNGLLSTDDLFIKSTGLNVGAKGAVDLIAQRVDTTLRVELFRFLEEVLKTVPITHWIFKKPNKILLPLVVHIKGPWGNPDVN